MKVLFVRAKANKEVVTGLEKSISKIFYKRLGLLTTVQFVHQLPEVKKFLQSKGFAVEIGKPNGPAILDGQVLGCDVSTALDMEKKVDCFLYIGTGDFHPIGLLIKTEKPIYIFNPFTEQLKEFDKSERTKLLRRKLLQIERFKDAKTIGILVSTKPGQFCATADEIKEKLEEQGKKAYLFVCDNIINDELRNFSHIDGWVNTACPRVAEDEFDRPLVNAADIDNLINENRRILKWKSKFSKRRKTRCG